MENEKGKQENQGENAGQNSSHKHIGEDHRNSRRQKDNKIAVREGRKEKSRQTNPSPSWRLSG